MGHQALTIAFLKLPVDKIIYKQENLFALGEKKFILRM